MSDMRVFKVDDIETIKTKLKSINENINSISGEVENMLRKVESYSGWKGKQKDELLAFLGTVSQYHKDVFSGGSPFETFVNSFEKITSGVSGYTGNSGCYKDLEKQS